MMHNRITDWLVVGLILVFVIAFLTFVQARSGVITGKLIDTSIFSQECQTLQSDSAFPITGNKLSLCENKTHELAYFEIRVPETTIQCNGSTLRGSGGALFVPRGVSNPRVTLSNCVLEGFDGLYQTQNPVQVRVE